MRIKSKLLISYLLLTLSSVSILLLLIGNKSQSIVYKEVLEKSDRVTELVTKTISAKNDFALEKIKTDLYFSEELLKNLGTLTIDQNKSIVIDNVIVPTLYAGKTELNLNNKLVDNIKNSTGEICSILLLTDDKLVRITTNIVRDDRRVIGTFIDSNSDIYKKIINNETYLGRNFIEGQWYLTGYKPLLDKNKKVIGALAIGDTQLKPDLEKFLLDTKIGETGYIYIIDSKGNTIVHPHIQGENIGAFDFAKNIINNKTGTIEYEFRGIRKVATYSYFAPWDWYIVTTANYDDLKSSSREITGIVLLAGGLILSFGVVLALIMSNTLVQPINNLKDCMGAAAKGDLSVHCNIDSKDEIGILSDSFNYMIQENKRLLEEVVQYDKLKTEFVANISHELKTPLTIIFSTAQLFSLNTNNQMAPEKSDKYMGIIKQNCYRLIRLVNNLIDITKIDSGFMELNLKTQNIVEVIENITLSTAEYVDSKHRTIIFDTDVEEKIMTFDSEKMERIILNLISNAIKFTNPNDTIEVNIYDKSDKILICVKDTGIGIPKDNHEKIFEKFKQVDPLLSRRSEGSGIGLSLVRSLVELHGGTISVKSELGQGSEFIIALPVRIIEEQPSCEVTEDLNQNPIEKIKIEFSDIYM